MINVEVATYQSQLDNQAKDVRAIFCTFATLLGAAIVTTVFTDWWYVTFIFLVVALAMLVPLADYYHKWQHNLRSLYEATRNIRTAHLDLM
jgi:hypothetical protein